MNIKTSLFPRKVFQMAAAATATVLVFIPPPVDPGDAPISIRTMVVSSAASDKLPESKVLSPAVLQETERKKASIQVIGVPVFNPEHLRITVPATRRMIVVQSTVFEWIRSDF